MKRRTASVFFSTLLIAIGYLYNSYVVQPDTTTRNNQVLQEQSQEVGSPKNNTNQIQDELLKQKIVKITDLPEKIANPTMEGIGSFKYIEAFVEEATDGDTLEVSYKKEIYKVRLLCIDTPESVKRGVEVQEYSKQAAEFTKSMTLKKTVRLVFDKGLRDRYGRLLAHVILDDGGYLNAMLIINGFARVEIVSPNTEYREYFSDLQLKAQDMKTGMWGLSKDRQPFVQDQKGRYIPRYKLIQQKAS